MFEFGDKHSEFKKKKAGREPATYNQPMGNLEGAKNAVYDLCPK